MSPLVAHQHHVRLKILILILIIIIFQLLLLFLLYLHHRGAENQKLATFCKVQIFPNDGCFMTTKYNCSES